MARSLDQLPPEILMTILDELHAWVLISVIRVNRRFFHLGIRRLWQMRTNISLARVPKGRRRLYTPVIQDLRLFGCPKEVYEEFKDSEFPNVKDLRVELVTDQASIADCRYLTHFMNAGLRSLSLNWAIPADLLRDVQNQCPRLATVSLHSSGPSVTPTDFLEFLRGLPYLKELKIHETDGHTMLNSKVIQLLAKSKRIEKLSLNRINRKLLKRALSVKTPFPELKRLNINSSQQALASLAKIFRSVVVLRLTLKHTRGRNTGETEVRIRPLSELTQLRHLDIYVARDMSIVPDDLVSLRSLSNLRRLTLKGVHEPSLRAAHFGDDDLHHLVSGLPDLETLSLKLFPSRVTAASLPALAKCCPRLERCTLDGMFNMRDLRDYEAPLFPRLSLLRFGYFMDSEIRGTDDLGDVVESRAYEHVQLLKKHFPEVWKFTWHHHGSPEEVEFSKRAARLLRRKNRHNY